ncbi:MAG: degA, partial [Paenibacillus sp.]|nr:degA [Paenibacillus sp.]
AGRAETALTKGKAKRTVGVIYIGDKSSASKQDIFKDTLAGICNECSQNEVNVNMITMSASDEYVNEDELEQKIMSSGVDGVIVITCIPRLRGFKRLSERQYPIVFIGSRRLAEWDKPLHSVASDNFEGGAAATEYLLSLGHRSIAVVLSDCPTPWEIDRMNGFFSAMRAAGVTVGDEAVIHVSRQFNPNEEGWRRLNDRQATGVFTTNSIIGHLALLYARSSGKRIPEQMSLITFDDSASFPFEDPPITIIEQDMEELGIISAKMLADLIEKPGQPARQVLISTKLVVRESCSPPHR